MKVGARFEGHTGCTFAKKDCMETFRLSEQWYTLVKTGKKTVEVRLHRGVAANLIVGGMIRFTDLARENPFTAQITAIVEYASTYDMLQSEGLACVLPGVATIEDGIQVYRQFYKEETENMHGILAIHVQI